MKIESTDKTDPCEEISIVCVYNDAVTRRVCLDSSIDALRREGGCIEYIPIDNTDHTFKTAGSALNYGIQQARNEFIVLVHQDVVLHSWTHLLLAASNLEDRTVGVVGAIGIGSNGVEYGQIWDRIAVAGTHCNGNSITVDSVDELLLIVRRSEVLRHPITEELALAWHGYGVEYCARTRRNGMRAVAADVMVTHNSETTNLLGLREAQRYICELYPDQLPMKTTCGVIDSPSPTSITSASKRAVGFVAGRVKSSRRRLGVASACHNAIVIASDIRADIDDLLRIVPHHNLEINCVVDDDTHWRSFPSHSTLQRREGTLVLRIWPSGNLDDLWVQLTDCEGSLVTRLSADRIAQIPRGVLDRVHLAGFHRDGGTWLLVGPDGLDAAKQLAPPRRKVLQKLVLFWTRREC